MPIESNVFCRLQSEQRGTLANLEQFAEVRTRADDVCLGWFQLGVGKQGLENAKVRLVIRLRRQPDSRII